MSEKEDGHRGTMITSSSGRQEGGGTAGLCILNDVKVCLECRLKKVSNKKMTIKKEE
jgi:hypothetical protein